MALWKGTKAAAAADTEQSKEYREEQSEVDLQRNKRIEEMNVIIDAKLRQFNISEVVESLVTSRLSAIENKLDSHITAQQVSNEKLETSVAALNAAPNQYKALQQQLRALLTANSVDLKKLNKNNKANKFPETHHKNQVVLPPELKLVYADHSVFYKLSQIQDRLKAALVPYKLWAQCPVPIDVVIQHHAALSNESILGFTRRIRDAWYMLPFQNRRNVMGREVLCNMLRQHAPSTWISIADLYSNWSTAEIVDQSVIRAEMLSRTLIEDKIFSKSAVTVQLQG
ncbi:Uu.00g115880.m01.CDS01 [Anthostomella pinea]|uniref:Uu.00g115880.m01.CDS01 n=1 Tax=Anthostomella pinea TaxID=933095 RepID=A0AAI8VH01_9PEZI|nr:Uu.00g115880.m01.CDS01 [Anthostomella pinea]